MGNPHAVPPITPPERLWKPGQSGNPKGRPKGIKDIRTQIREILKRKMEVTDPIDKKTKKMTIGQQIVTAQVGQALKGNTKAFNALVDRLEGKVTQPLEHLGKDGESLIPPQVNLIGIVPQIENDSEG